MTACLMPGCTAPAARLEGAGLAKLRKQAPNWLGVPRRMYCASHEAAITLAAGQIPLMPVGEVRG